MISYQGTGGGLPTLAVVQSEKWLSIITLNGIQTNLQQWEKVKNPGNSLPGNYDFSHKKIHLMDMGHFKIELLFLIKLNKN